MKPKDKIKAYDRILSEAVKIMLANPEVRKIILSEIKKTYFKECFKSGQIRTKLE